MAAPNYASLFTGAAPADNAQAAPLCQTSCPPGTVSDFHHYLGITGNFKNDTNTLFNVDAKAITNIMLGAEYYLLADVGFRLGFFTNFSSAKEVATYLTAIDDKVHMFGGTAAIVFDKPTGSISLGGYVIGGQGSSGTLDQTPTVTRRSNYIYGFVVGSNYKF